MRDKKDSNPADGPYRLRREQTRISAAQAERDQALAAFRESERQYRHLVDHADDIIYRCDSSGHFTYFNPAATRLLGYAESEIQGRHYLDLIHPDYRKAAERFYFRQWTRRITHTYYEYPVVAQDGRLLWLGQNVQLIVEQGDVVGFQAIARDITQQRETGAALKQAYADLEHRVEERTAELRTVNESLQRETTERRRLIERQRRLMEIAAAINASQELDPILRLVRDAVIEASDFDRAGVFRVEGSAVYGAWGTDEAGGLMDAHGIIEALDDWGPRLGSLISGESRFYIEELTEDARPIGSENVSIPHAVVALRAAGELVGLLSVDNLLSGRPVLAENILPLLPFAEQAAVAIQNARLFQELRRTQGALVHSEKLRAVGELASGIAHNVNNVLAVVLGYAELIPLAEGDTAQIDQYAGIIAKAAEHGADIVRRMQQFVRKETDAGREVFDLAETAREAIEFTRPAWFDQALGRGVRIGVETALQGELWVRGIASELRDVIVNLIKNAVDAMPEGGLLTIRGSVEADAVILDVMDTGVGMDETVRRRVFEPFFTTKQIGQGTGLGLSVAWGILNRHQGRITVQSAPGQGATFRLHLPLTNEAVVSAPQASAPTPLVGRRLLLVDDEIPVLGSLARALEASGAVVTAVPDAFQALKGLEARGAEFDMVVSDQGMPDMTGTELLSEIRRRWPNLRRVLLSGWGPNLPGDADISAAELILGKPLSRQALAHALSGLLSSAPAAGQNAGSQSGKRRR